MEPMMLRNVALDDGHETGQPRFRRQQVVEGGVEASRPFGVGRRYPMEKMRRRRSYRKSKRMPLASADSRPASVCSNSAGTRSWP